MRDNKNLLQKAKKVQMLMLDVDGVLTDGSILYSEDGKEIKVFNVLDGHGIVMLKKAGIKTVIVSGRKSKALKKRAQELGIKDIYQGVFDKTKILKVLISKAGIKKENVCYMGDDITDIALLKDVGFSVSVPNGTKEVKRIVDYITKKKGGNGAVREVAEMILKAKGLWREILHNYM